MKIFDYRNKLLLIDQLIRLSATGTPKELANKLDICEASVYNLLFIIKELAFEQDADVKFDRCRLLYYYTKPLKLYFGFKLLNE